jgi:hypothetical protein
VIGNWRSRGGRKNSTRADRSGGHGQASPESPRILECLNARLRDSGGQLTIDWAGGGGLTFPVAWCIDLEIRVIAKSDTVQFLCRFSPTAPSTGQPDFIAIRLSVRTQYEQQACRIADRIRGDVARLRDLPAPAHVINAERRQGTSEDPMRTDDTPPAAANGHYPALVPDTDDWISFRPRPETEQFLDRLRRHAPFSMTSERLDQRDAR